MMKRYLVSPPQKKNTEQRLLEIQEKLRDWTCFVAELPVPSELVMALQTNRIELAKSAKPRPMSEEEVGMLFTLIGGLLETNAVLREHASLVSQLTHQMSESLRGVNASIDKIVRFADFQTPDEDEAPE